VTAHHGEQVMGVTSTIECPNGCGHCHLCGYLAPFESCLVVLINPLILPAAKARRAAKEATQHAN